MISFKTAGKSQENISRLFHFAIETIHQKMRRHKIELYSKDRMKLKIGRTKAKKLSFGSFN